MKRSLLWVSVVVVLGVSVAGGIAAQSTAPKGSDTAETAQAVKRRGPLPFYFGKLGVSDSQRDKLYAVQEEYEQKLKPLLEQIERLEHERDQKMEGMLTPGQKLRLSELRTEAAREAERDKKAGDAKTKDTKDPVNR